MDIEYAFLKVKYEAITNDTSESKLAIQRVAENEFHKTFNVMCAKSDFAYFVYTETFCQMTIADVTCYAF
uniref:Ground-like domain-containing protein n=1 Tax=Parascaris equorum TaxID=6256 RepID=A0A914RG56_PAREQ